MGRNPKYDRTSITAAALELVAEGGPQAATMAAIAERVGAPTGSIYHRYRSRDLLLAELWMGVVEGFQNGVAALLSNEGAGAREEAAEIAVRVAQFMPRWVRDHLLEARLLLLHRRQDFASGTWPTELVGRAEALETQLVACLRGFSRRAWGSASKAAMARARFVLLDVPYAAVKPYVQAGKAPPRVVDELVEKTARAIVE